jgi:hypothetical protein
LKLAQQKGNGIVEEENRRLFWYVRESDISGSAASKRVHFIQLEEYVDLQLPVPDPLFYSTSKYPGTISIRQFMNPSVVVDGLGVNAFMMVLESIYARITTFRRNSESLDMKIFDISHGGELVQEYQRIRQDLALFYHRLPVFVHHLGSATSPLGQSMQEKEWIMLRIIYHSTFASLHGISN